MFTDDIPYIHPLGIPVYPFRGCEKARDNPSSLGERLGIGINTGVRIE